MSRSQYLKKILDQAREKEKKYDWLRAIEFYEKASSFALRKKDFLRASEIEGQIGYCFYRVAFQAETLKEFKSCMQLAAGFYEKGAELFEKIEETETRAEMNHCKAMVRYANSWLLTDSSAKREELDECWRLEKEALKEYEKAADLINMAKTCNNLMIFLTDRLIIEWDAESREKIVEEALEYGERAIQIFSKAQNRRQLVHTYILTSFFCRNAAFVRRFDAKRREESRKRTLRYSQKAIEISEEMGDAYLIGVSNLCLADSRLDILGTTGLQERQHYEKALQCGFLTKDNLLIADALFGLQFSTNFSAITQEDPDKAREEYRKLDKYWEDAVRYYSIVAHNSGLAMAYFQMIIPIEGRSELEINLENRRLLLEKSVKLGYKGLDHARLSGSMAVTFHITRSLSVAIFCLARIETDTRRKRNLLSRSAKLMEQSIGILKQASAASLVEPKEVNLAFIFWALAINQFELANAEKDVDEKINILENAITNMRSAREYWLEWTKSPWARAEEPHWFIVGENEIKTGKTLNQLYTLSGDLTFLGDSLAAFERSVNAYDKANLPSRVAEAYWQIAKTYYQLAEYAESAKSFESAYENYKLAAEKTPQLKGFYMDYALYMLAWSEMEKARRYHAEKQHGQAKGHYKKTADLLKSTSRWNYLHLNYLAWARLEEAEDHSRREQTKEARDLFQQTGKLFGEAKKSIEDARIQLRKIQVRDEKEMVDALVAVSDTRREYCLGRIALEEAKILDRQGDHDASSRKYGSAAEKFQKAIDASEDESDRRELRPIVCLCRAWQKMTQAEAEASPDLYLEASELFVEAKTLTSNEKAKTLALGHSRFCKALEAGTKFEDTTDIKLYSAAIQHLESAANYYIKAGFKTASEYAIAMHRFFDGYIYMKSANQETDPERKARYCIVAEKVLKTSVESYLKAKHPEKAAQVHRLLDKVIEERKLATLLSEVLHAPTITSSTASFVTPTPTHEKAVGLERFEHANIQGLLTVPEKVTVEEELEIQLDLVNVARNFGLLIRIDNLIPKGFKVTEPPRKYALEDGSLDMKGKRFEPLKVESIRILARATDFGIFKVNPQVVYIDESGQFRICSPEAAYVKVGTIAKRAAEEKTKKKYELVYRDLLKECPRNPKSECRVAIAQIGVSKTGDILNEFYEEKATALFGLREDKVETVRAKVKDMIEIAHAKEVNFLIFPELTVDLNYSKMLEDITSLAKAYEMYIIPGSYHDGETKRNISVVVGPDGILWQQEKHVPAIIRHKSERFREGIEVGAIPRKTFVCNTEFGRIAITICRDFLDMDLRVELKDFEPPVDVVFNPAFTPVTADFKAAHFDARTSIYAYCFFANVAEFGESFIYTPGKERIGRKIPAREESLIYKDVNLLKLRSERKKWEKEQGKERPFIQSTR